jgi:hypothetical protein
MGRKKILKGSKGGVIILRITGFPHFSPYSGILKILCFRVFRTLEKNSQENKYIRDRELIYNKTWKILYDNINTFYAHCDKLLL